MVAKYQVKEEVSGLVTFSVRLSVREGYETI